MLNTPFPPWPHFTPEEAEAVRQVLLSNKVNYWTGKECRLFEQEFATWTGCTHAVALANGTVALDLALHALGISAGDEVVVTPRTFMASVSCVVNAGAVPVFADVDLNSQNMTADTIRAVVTPRTKAIICVHLAGWPCDMDSIMSLAKKHGLFVIEDCAQAHGAKYKGQSVGTIGHIGAWSFCQDKIMTTGGEGGMVTTNDNGLWSKMWSYKDHGKSWDAIYNATDHPSGFRWLHERFGTNWRMLEMQAAIGRLQLEKMVDWHAQRSRNLSTICNECRALPGLRVPDMPRDITHAAYKCYIFVRPEQLKSQWNRDKIMAAITKQGVPCFSGSCPEVYLEKAFDGTGWRPQQRLPNAKELGETSLMFLVHPGLTEDDLHRTIKTIKVVMNQATR